MNRRGLQKVNKQCREPTQTSALDGRVRAMERVKAHLRRQQKLPGFQRKRRPNVSSRPKSQIVCHPKPWNDRACIENESAPVGSRKPQSKTRGCNLAVEDDTDYEKRILQQNKVIDNKYNSFTRDNYLNNSPSSNGELSKINIPNYANSKLGSSNISCGFNAEFRSNLQKGNGAKIEAFEENKKTNQRATSTANYDRKKHARPTDQPKYGNHGMENFHDTITTEDTQEIRTKEYNESRILQRLERLESHLHLLEAEEDTLHNELFNGEIRANAPKRNPKVRNIDNKKDVTSFELFSKAVMNDAKNEDKLKFHFSPEFIGCMLKLNRSLGHTDKEHVERFERVLEHIIDELIHELGEEIEEKIQEISESILKSF